MSHFHVLVNYPTALLNILISGWNSYSNFKNVGCFPGNLAEKTVIWLEITTTST